MNTCAFNIVLKSTLIVLKCSSPFIICVKNNGEFSCGELTIDNTCFVLLINVF